MKTILDTSYEAAVPWPVVTRLHVQPYEQTDGPGLIYGVVAVYEDDSWRHALATRDAAKACAEAQRLAATCDKPIVPVSHHGFSLGGGY